MPQSQHWTLAIAVRCDKDLDTDEFFMGDDENSGWEPAEIDGKPARLHLVKGRYFIEPW